jgi:23S rRNA pseudouridine2605 synthase
MAEVRLQKFLAECGVGSRRKMEQFITEGRVRVNQQVVTDLGRKIDPDVDKVEVNRRPVHAAPKGILVFNKPRGVVSTMSDPEGRRSVADFLTKKYQSYFPVGRLDWDSTGLMVLTNDGEIAERLMHPRYGFERIYHARVEGTVSNNVLEKISRGVRLSDGVVKATASILNNDENTTWIEISLSEGRNRVVRRLFEKLGHAVMKLKRTVYGPFKLGRLGVGQMRALTLSEYEQARRKVLTFKPGQESAGAAAPAAPSAAVAPARRSSRSAEGRFRDDSERDNTRRPRRSFTGEGDEREQRGSRGRFSGARRGREDQRDERRDGERRPFAREGGEREQRGSRGRFGGARRGREDQRDERREGERRPGSFARRGPGSKRPQGAGRGERSSFGQDREQRGNRRQPERSGGRNRFKGGAKRKP